MSIMPIEAEIVNLNITSDGLPVFVPPSDPSAIVSLHYRYSTGEGFTLVQQLCPTNRIDKYLAGLGFKYSCHTEGKRFFIKGVQPDNKVVLYSLDELIPDKAFNKF